MPSLLRETRKFNQMLDAITPEQLHGEIGLEYVLSDQF